MEVEEAPVESIIEGEDFSFMKGRHLAKPSLSSIGIWGLIVCCVITGDFIGFNIGLQYGLGSMIVAHIFVCTLGIAVSLDLNELGTSFPYASACASYAYAAFGGIAGCFMGYTYTFNILMFLTESTLAVANIISEGFGINRDYESIWWILSIGLCMLLNMRPIVLFRVIVFNAVACILMLLIILCIMIPYLDFSQSFLTKMPDGTISTDFLPFGISGVIKSLPYALFFLGCFDMLPCVSEETINIKTNLPRGMMMGLGTMILVSWPTLIIASALPKITSLYLTIRRGTGDYGILKNPFGETLNHIFLQSTKGKGKFYPNFETVVVPIMLSGQIGLMYALTRIIYGLSRGGFLPGRLSLTSKNGAPYWSIIVSGVAVVILASILSYIHRLYSFDITKLVLNMATFFGLCAFAVGPAMSVKIRMVYPNLNKPWKSPFGLYGTMYGSFGASFSLIGLIVLEVEYKYFLLGLCAMFIICIPNYILIVRPNLKLSPDQSFIIHSQMKEAGKKFRRKKKNLTLLLNNKNMEQGKVINRLKPSWSKSSKSLIEMCNGGKRPISEQLQKLSVGLNPGQCITSEGNKVSFFDCDDTDERLSPQIYKLARTKIEKEESPLKANIFSDIDEIQF